jgi:hypothetical protein
LGQDGQSWAMATNDPINTNTAGKDTLVFGMIW